MLRLTILTDSVRAVRAEHAILLQYAISSLNFGQEVAGEPPQDRRNLWLRHLTTATRQLVNSPPSLSLRSDPT